MKEVGLDKVLYVDTDSIKIRQKHKKPLNDYIHQTELGGLKLEKTFKRFYIHTLKDYESDNETVRKGVPKKAKINKDGKYEYISFLKQDSHLRKEVTRYFITREVTKVLKRTYDKGIVTASGKVLPFRLKE